METIRILFYTDSSEISHPMHLRGLDDLELFIKLKMKGIAIPKITVRNRHFDYENNRPVNGATRLTKLFLADYDELWVFGALKTNSENGSHNELEGDEIAALSEWMTRGGVFITGDHSEPPGNLKCKSPHKDFINLGAAIGREIPRAGKLRVWDGPPTSCLKGELELRDNFNTQEGDNPAALDTDILQQDNRPQTLRLLPSDPPHRLFWWYFDKQTQKIVPITKFPDHTHEGHLRIPTDLGDPWPAHSLPPIPVAAGRDKRFVNEERYSNVVIAYDDDLARVGRIVADSSFHHYINLNLVEIRSRNANREPIPLSDLDQIAQYYCNLALWLAPKDIRDQINWGLLFWAGGHPEVLEVRGNDIDVLGSTAKIVLEQEIGTSNLYRLLAPSKHEKGARQIEDLLAHVFIGEEIGSEFAPYSEQALGFVVEQYHEFFVDDGIDDPGWHRQDPAPARVAINGLEQAFESLPNSPHELLSQFRPAADALENMRKRRD